MKHLIRPQHLAAGILAGLIAWVMTIGFDRPAEQDAASLHNHCEMVELYRASAGEYGWPDFNNTAHLCPAQATPAGSGSNQRVEP